jgi:phage FluMu protein Com
MSPIVWARALQCTRCGKVWIPQKGVDHPPKVCPKCASRYWDIPITNQGASEASRKGSEKWQRQFGNQD